MNYDWQVTEGRFLQENIVFDRGFTVGLLGDYLADDPAGYYPDDLADWVYSGNLPEVYNVAIAEGASCRSDYTAEELFIWAHEFEKEALR